MEERMVDVVVQFAGQLSSLLMIISNTRRWRKHFQIRDCTVANSRFNQPLPVGPPVKRVDMLVVRLKLKTFTFCWLSLQTCWKGEQNHLTVFVIFERGLWRKAPWRPFFFESSCPKKGSPFGIHRSQVFVESVRRSSSMGKSTGNGDFPRVLVLTIWIKITSLLRIRN